MESIEKILTGREHVVAVARDDDVAMPTTLRGGRGA